MSLSLDLVERGVLPDPVVRFGIRRLLKQRLREEDRGSHEAQERALAEFEAELRSSRIALHTDEANEQHYELPPAFFEACLGPHLKYSSCYYPTGSESLGEAELAMLELVAERAQLADGQDVLELGCGWGSLALWAAERFPNTRYTAVSNSAPQREFIEAAAAERGLTNLEVLTADMNTFGPEQLGTERSFDRVVSVEMFEHMRNYDLLLERIRGWLREDGRLFVHIFAHKTYAYPFETEGADNWMGRHFFTGGIMPSHDLLLRFSEHMELDERWTVPGTHYSRTSEHWLQNLDARRADVMPVLEATYGPESARMWFQRWRVFFLSCAELFGYAKGTQWWVSHYLFRPANLELT